MGELSYWLQALDHSVKLSKGFLQPIQYTPS